MHGQTEASSKPFVTHLRKTMTDAERKLWQRLRARQLGVKFRRQHPFQGYVLDFVCLEHRLVIEVDGSQHAEAAVRDAVRTAVLERAGFRVVRFWNNEVLAQTDAVVECVVRELNSSPSLALPLEGEGNFVRGCAPDGETHPLPVLPLEGEGTCESAPVSVGS